MLLPLLVDIGKLALYAIVGAVVMGIALGVFLRILDKLTPLNEWEELKKGNIAVAVYFAAAVLALGLVIMASIWPIQKKITASITEPVQIHYGMPEQP